jgi:hypothetical protein
MDKPCGFENNFRKLQTVCVDLKQPLKNQNLEQTMKLLTKTDCNVSQIIMEGQEKSVNHHIVLILDFGFWILGRGL